MPIDPADRWIIDYRTACLIVENETAARNGLVSQLCQNGAMHVVHKERERFRQHPDLDDRYIQNGCCIDLCEEVRERAKFIANHPQCRTEFSIDPTNTYIAAAAMHHGFMVVTDQLLTAGLSLAKICQELGLQYFRRGDFFQYIE